MAGFAQQHLPLLLHGVLEQTDVDVLLQQCLISLWWQQINIAQQGKRGVLQQEKVRGEGSPCNTSQAGGPKGLCTRGFLSSALPGCPITHTIGCVGSEQGPYPSSWLCPLGPKPCPGTIGHGRQCQRGAEARCLQQDSSLTSAAVSSAQAVTRRRLIPKHLQQQT